MIENLKEYFNSEQQIFLDTISYNRIESPDKVAERISLLCKDDIKTSVDDNGVRVILTRSLVLDPNTLFSLKVSFGADLKFNDRKSEHEWSNINLAEEFCNNGDFVIKQLMSRISLLIGQITCSSGQQPILLPPTIISDNQNQGD